MNELIKVYLDTDQPTILARDLYNGLGIQTKYTTWLERMAEYGFQEGKDFFPFLGKSPSRIYVRKEKNLVSVNGILIDGSHYIDSRREDRNCIHSHRNGGKTRNEIMLYF